MGAADGEKLTWEAPLGPLRFIVSTHQFWKGAVAGFVGAGIAVGASAGARRRLLPTAGAAFALAAFVALAWSGRVAAGHRIPVAVGAGAASSFVLTELARRVRPSLWVSMAAGVPGAIITAGALVGVAGWIRCVTAAFCAVGGACLADFDVHNARSGSAPLLWLITVGAVYSTVPDTEAARALLGVAIAIAFLGWPVVYARIGIGGAAASACMLGWVIGQDGAGRAGAVVGAAGTVGVFALEPLVRRALAYARNFDASRTVELAPALAVHLAWALVAARWAGLAHDTATAVMRLLVALPIALLLTSWIYAGSATRVRTTPREPRRPTQHRR